MTNRLEINWKLDGFVDEQRYYCSETPIDIANLPNPKAVLRGDARGYADFDIADGGSYYIIVSSVKNLVEKLSYQIFIETQNLDLYTAVFPLLINGVDIISSVESFAIFGASQFTTIGCYFDGAGSYLSKDTSTISEFGSGNFTIEIDFKTERVGSHSYEQVLVDNYSAGTGSFQILLTSNGKVTVYVTNPSSYLITSPLSYSDGIDHKLKFIRAFDGYYLYIDGNLVAQSAQTYHYFTGAAKLSLAAQVASRNPNYDFKGWLKNFRLSKQAIL